MGKLEACNVVDKVIEELVESPQSEACARLETMGMALVAIAKVLEGMRPMDKLRVIRAAAALNGIDTKVC